MEYLNILEGKMKFLLVCAALCLINSLCMAANKIEIDMKAKYDTFKGTNSEVKIHFIGHASLMIENNGKVYHIDPWSEMGDYSKMPKADVIFVTHEHFDHYDKNLIKQLSKEDTKIITTAAVAEDYGKNPNVIVLNNGDNALAGDVKVEAVPAYNIQHLRDGKNPFHPKGRGNGYLLSIDDLRIYIAGDTENVPEIKTISDVEVAFLPFNLPYTMDKAMFEDLAKSIKAKYLYPYHTMGMDQKTVDSVNVPDSIVRIRKFEK